MRSGFDLCFECEREREQMSKQGKVWDALTEGERRALLAFAGIWEADEIVFHEVTLKWDQLLPSTQGRVLERLAGKK
jgi:hypothetical protein